MMAGYSKLDSGIIHSTIWSEPHDVRVTWITLLAVTDAAGIVRMAIPALAKLVDVPVERMEQILELLHAPDKYSRTKDNDGRRLETVDGGWRILNYSKYREGLKQPDVTAAERKRRQRERGKSQENVTARHGGSVTVTASHAYAEAEAEAEANKEDSFEPASGSSKQPPADSLMRFQVSGKPPEWHLTQSKLDEWQSLYGKQLDVIHECRKARQWMIDNPSRRKTARGMSAFLNRWLDRAANNTRGGTMAPSGNSPAIEAALEEARANFNVNRG